MDIPPNQTIYVSNLYEKIPKEGTCCPDQRSSKKAGVTAQPTIQGVCRSLSVPLCPMLLLQS